MECGAANLHIEMDPKIVVNLQHRDISTTLLMEPYLSYYENIVCKVDNVYCVANQCANTLLTRVPNNVRAPKLSVLILDYRMQLGQEWIVFPCHVFRKANGMADELAKKGREHRRNVREYNECPNFVYIKYVCDIL